MYQVKGFWTNGGSTAREFSDEARARIEFASILQQYNSRGDNLFRVEMWDDSVLIAVYSQHGLKVEMLNPCGPTVYGNPFKWTWGRDRNNVR